MKKGLIKNGIVISYETKSTFNKQVCLNGFVMTTYVYCPKNLKFTSPMVNDTNQDLCGGWSRFRNEDEVIFNRVLAGKKPLGSIYLKDGVDRISKHISSNFAYKIYDIGNKFLDICCRGKLGDLFDLNILASDYSRFAPYISNEILSYKNVNLESFLGGKWDNQGWLTGLVLGYPIENTISRIYR